MPFITCQNCTFTKAKEFIPVDGAINEPIPSPTSEGWIGMGFGKQLYYFFDTEETSENFNIDLTVYLRVKTSEGYKVILCANERDIMPRSLSIFNMFESITNGDLALNIVVTTTFTNLPLSLYTLWV